MYLLKETLCHNLFSIEVYSKYIKITESHCLHMKQFKGEVIFGLNLLCFKMKGIFGVAAEKQKYQKKRKKEEDETRHCEG